MTNTVTTLLVQDLNNDGDLWIECKLCGGGNYQSRGPIRHKRGCRSDAQYVPGVTVIAGEAAPAVPVEIAKVADLASAVRRTGLTKGRDEEVLQAVRLGYLSESDAMNTDD